MPFTWNAETVPEDVRTVEVDGKKKLNPITQTLVYATISIGMPRITTSTAPEFYSRVRMYERLLGAGTWQAADDSEPGAPWPQPLFITPLDVRNHIGLSTNANTMTKARFRTFLFERAARMFSDSYGTAAEQVEADERAAGNV